MTKELGKMGKISKNVKFLQNFRQFCNPGGGEGDGKKYLGIK